MQKTLLKHINKIENKNIPAFVMDLINDLLLKGELKPGDKLPTENEFSQLLGVGRNSVREAIKMLSCIGVVEIKRAEGTFISNNITSPMLNPVIYSIALSEFPPKELIELRLLFDTAIGELICEKITSIEVDELKNINNAILEEINVEDTDSINKTILQKYDMEFHILMMKAAKNSLITKIGKTIYTLFFNSMAKSIGTNPMSVYQNHKIIIEALETKKPQKVRKAINNSLSHWKKLTETQD